MIGSRFELAKRYASQLTSKTELDALRADIQEMCALADEQYETEKRKDPDFIIKAKEGRPEHQEQKERWEELCENGSKAYARKKALELFDIARQEAIKQLGANADSFPSQVTLRMLNKMESLVLDRWQYDRLKIEELNLEGVRAISNDLHMYRRDYGSQEDMDLARVIIKTILNDQPWFKLQRKKVGHSLVAEVNLLEALYLTLGSEFHRGTSGPSPPGAL